MNIKIDTKYYHFALTGYLLLIFIESSFPGDKLPKIGFEFGDKIIHFIVYSVLFVLFFYSLKNQSKYVKLRKFAPEFALLFTSLYGITDELHQYFVPNRSCEIYDWMADTAGALTVYFVLKYTMNIRKETVLLFASVFIFNCASSQDKPDADKISVSFTETDVWLNKMPVVDETKNNFGFVISMNLETDIPPEKLSVKDFRICINNDTISGKKTETHIFEAAKGLIKININQDNDVHYLLGRKEDPDTVSFNLKIYGNDKFLKKIITPEIKVNSVY